MTKPKTYYLSQIDKKIAGLCGGLAEYFNFDVTLVRLVVLFVVLVTGFFPGTLAYIVIAFIAPKGPEAVAKK